MFMMNASRCAAACLAAGLTVCAAQQPRQYTAQDYAAAERFMSYNVNALGYPGQVHAQSTDHGRFWYRAVDATGVTYMLIDPVKAKSSTAFDQAKLAAALHAANAVIKDDPHHLQLSDLAFANNDGAVTLSAGGSAYVCDLAATPATCKRLTSASEGPMGPEPGPAE